MTKDGDMLAIGRVPPDSPAERAGLRVGDIVTAVNGEAVATRAELYRRLWRERPGADIVLTIIRDGAPHEVRLRAMDQQDYLIHRAQL
jgi:serine protease Do